ncbi:MAG: hypothetical protein ACYC3H_04270 [Bellilinea sp.]
MTQNTQPIPKKKSHAALWLLGTVALIVILVAYVLSQDADSTPTPLQPTEQIVAGMYEDELYEFKAYCEEVVKLALKSPATAEFPSIGEWQFRRPHDSYVEISSYVDAQNSFGALIRSDFTIQIRYNDRDLLWFELDGETIYGSRRQ